MSAHFLNSRAIDRRLVWHALVELTSPCHLGGEDADATSDRPLLRDGDGRPFLPGTTLTGLLRGLLNGVDTRAARALFGAEWGNDKDARQARLLVSDAAVEVPAAASGGSSAIPTELRDGVRIDPESGIADDKKKFDLELLPVGTRLALRWQLDLPGDPDRDTLLLRGASMLARLIDTGRLALGARTRRGLGATALVEENGSRWRIEDYRLDSIDGWYAWLGLDLAGLPRDWPAVAPRVFADAVAIADYLGTALPPDLSPSVFEVRLYLRSDGSLLLGSDGHDPGGPDRGPLTRLALGGKDVSQLEPVLSGTALAGVLRHRCLRIALTLAASDHEPAAENLVDWMFGPARIRRHGRNRASRLLIREVPIRDSRRLRHTRARIDPWTGGALESLLFTEDAEYGGKVEPVLELGTSLGKQAPNGPARALLLLALRDLAAGELSVGGGGGIGRGRLRPRPGESFAITTHPPARLYLEPDGGVRCEPEDAFGADFDALHRYLNGGAEQ